MFKVFLVWADIQPLLIERVLGSHGMFEKPCALALLVSFFLFTKAYMKFMEPPQTNVENGFVYSIYGAYGTHVYSFSSLYGHPCFNIFLTTPMHSRFL